MPQSSEPLDREAANAVAPEAEAGRAIRRRTASPDVGKDLRPIGPERLRRLRESIRNGTYALEDRAGRGLLRMFLGYVPRRSDAEEEV